MSEELDATLRRMEKAAEVILHDILNGTDTRYEPAMDEILGRGKTGYESKGDSNTDIQNSEGEIK